MRKFELLLCVMALSLVAMAQNNISLPTGTSLTVKLENNIATSSSKTGDSFSARVTEAVVLEGKTVVPVGATVQGKVAQVSEPRRISGRPTIGIFPEALVMPDGQRFVLSASLVQTDAHHGTSVSNEGEFKGRGHDSQDLTEIGMATGGGMVIGGLAGGGKGVVIGGVIGATATVVHWLGKKKSATLLAGTELVMELSRPLEMAPAAVAGQ
ncbi:exported hypothetical protein [Candidatus Sulfotelmatobacter sp. SbA7]|nr:exported hypothetical protein [Candidatus Sulfotelmatobacter sp. SbA7]